MVVVKQKPPAATIRDGKWCANWFRKGDVRYQHERRFEQAERAEEAVDFECSGDIELKHWPLVASSGGT